MPANKSKSKKPLKRSISKKAKTPITEPQEVDKGGRPTKYRPDFNNQVKKLCLLGYIDKQLADFFEISEATLNNWKLEYPKFLEAIKAGKDMADGNVVESLYNRARGYKAKDLDIRVIKGKIVKTVIDKEYAPDPTSMIFWLKNRNPKEWRDRHQIDTTYREVSAPEGMTEDQAAIFNEVINKMREIDMETQPKETDSPPSE